MRTGEERKIMELRRRIRWKRTKKELVIYAAGAVLMISFLYLVMQQRVE
jgi:predicted permease